MKIHKNKLEVETYSGTNETINRLMEPQDVIYIVQGPCGRAPILADDEEEAKARYIEKNQDRQQAVTEDAA